MKHHQAVDTGVVPRGLQVLALTGCTDWTKACMVLLPWETLLQKAVWFIKVFSFCGVHQVAPSGHCHETWGGGWRWTGWNGCFIYGSMSFSVLLLLQLLCTSLYRELVLHRPPSLLCIHTVNWSRYSVLGNEDHLMCWLGSKRWIINHLHLLNDTRPEAEVSCFCNASEKRWSWIQWTCPDSDLKGNSWTLRVNLICKEWDERIDSSSCDEHTAAADSRSQRLETGGNIYINKTL